MVHFTDLIRIQKESLQKLYQNIAGKLADHRVTILIATNMYIYHSDRALIKYMNLMKIGMSLSDLATETVSRARKNNIFL